MQINISELKAHLSDTLQRVQSGQTVTVMNRRTPVARITPFMADDGLVVRPASCRLRDLALPQRPTVAAGALASALAEERTAER